MDGCIPVATIRWTLGREQFEKVWCEEYGPIPASDVDAFLALFPEQAQNCTVDRQPYINLGYPKYEPGFKESEWRQKRGHDNVDGSYEEGADAVIVFDPDETDNFFDSFMTDTSMPDIGLDNIIADAVGSGGTTIRPNPWTGGNGVTVGTQTGESDGYYNTANGRCKKWTCEEKCQYKRDNPIKKCYPCAPKYYRRRYYKRKWYSNSYCKSTTKKRRYKKKKSCSCS
jgi:hypothetical protein